MEEFSKEEIESAQAELGAEQPAAEEAQAVEEAQANPAAAPERPPGYVPHEALHEQRETNKRLMAELSAMREKTERMEGTFQKLLSTANEKPAPTFEEDPLGHFQAKNRALEEQLHGVSGKLETYEKELAQQAEMQKLASAIQAAEHEFRAKNQDYDSAVKYLKDVRRADLADIGVPAAQIEAILQNEIISFGQTALAQGKSPAQTAYQMAKRYGFKGAEKGAEKKIATISQGLEASKTVQGGGANPISLQDLSQLPDDQLDAILKDDAKWQALMRGGTIK